MQIEFDWGFTGEQLRDAGIGLATEHADAVQPKWSQMAYLLLIDYLKDNKRFMAEDFREYAAAKNFAMPPHARAWGGVMARAAREYIIIKTSIQPVKNPKAHCANAGVWERNDERLLNLNQ